MKLQMNVAASSNANKRLEASKIMELCNSAIEKSFTLILSLKIKFK